MDKHICLVTLVQRFLLETAEASQQLPFDFDVDLNYTAPEVSSSHETFLSRHGHATR